MVQVLTLSRAACLQKGCRMVCTAVCTMNKDEGFSGFRGPFLHEGVGPKIK